MKVLLINPPFIDGSTWGDFKSVGAYNPPLGLCYLAAALNKHNVEVQIDDAFIRKRSIEGILEGIKEFSPDVIGITSTSILFEDAKKLARAIKNKHAQPLIIGGPHVTILPDNAMQCEDFDCGVIGEGEETTVELMQHFKGERTLDSINGIIYREDGTLKQTAPRKPRMDLDRLPQPALDLLPPLDTYVPQAFSYRKRPVGYVLSSRGCPFACIYCIRIMGKTFRAHSPERVVDDIERLLHKFGAKEIHFSDDCFAVDANRINAICNLILKRKLKFKWKCITHPNSLDYDLLRKMKSAGCWFVGIGVESADTAMMKFIKKKINLKHLQKVISWADELGIAVKGFFIIGFPSETRMSLQNTIDFSLQNPFFSVTYNIAYLNPGSEMDQLADKYGRVNRQPHNVAAYSPDLSFVPHGFTAEYLKKTQRQAYLRFYLRPKQIIKMLRLNRNVDNYLRAIQAVYALMARMLKHIVQSI